MIDSLETILRAITELDDDVVRVMAVLDRYLDDHQDFRTRVDLEHRQRENISRLRTVIAELHNNLMQALADRAKHATIDVGDQVRKILSDVAPDGFGRSLLGDVAKINRQT